MVIGRNHGPIFVMVKDKERRKMVLCGGGGGVYATKNVDAAAGMRFLEVYHCTTKA